MTVSRPTESPLQWPALLETILLGSMAAMLLAKTARGALVFYIHPRYTWLVVVAGVVLAVLAVVRTRAIFQPTTTPAAGPSASYVVVGLAVLLGTLVPARPLGANTLASTTIGARTGAVAQMPQGDSRQWDLLQWSIAQSIDSAALAGKPVDVVGFVFHPPAGTGDFVVARYVLTCCTADGSAAGLPVMWAQGVALPADSWVRVTGRLGSVTHAGVPEPAIIAERVELVPQPKSPYLYGSQ